MQVCFLEPPPLASKRAPERVAGCAYGLYPVPNIFVLIAAAILEERGNRITVENFPIKKATRSDFETYLKSDRSDIYCIYGVNLSRETDLQSLSLIRKYRGENRAVIFFGPSPSDIPAYYLVDNRTFVVRGEPEETLAELVAALDGNGPFTSIYGISYRDSQSEIVDTPFRPLIDDLDALPFPARHLLDRMLYYNPKLGLRPYTQVLGSRNCPYHCQYCVPCSLSFATELEYRRFHENRKPPVRKRSAGNIIAEIEELYHEGYKAFSFADDQFILGRERAIEICRGIEKFSLKWGCATRVDHVTEDVLKAMARAGCTFIDLGIESFNQAILDDINKELDVRIVAEKVALIKKVGIAAKANILLGASPLETRETIEETLVQARKMKFEQVMVNICNPFPGTDYYRRAKTEGWLVHGDYVPSDVQKEAIIRYPHLEPEELVSAVRRANMRFFLNPGFMIHHLRKFRSVHEFLSAIGALWRKLAP